MRVERGQLDSMNLSRESSIAFTFFSCFGVGVGVVLVTVFLAVVEPADWKSERFCTPVCKARVATGKGAEPPGRANASHRMSVCKRVRQGRNRGCCGYASRQGLKVGEGAAKTSSYFVLQSCLWEPWEASCWPQSAQLLLSRLLCPHWQLCLLRFARCGRWRTWREVWVCWGWQIGVADTVCVRACVRACVCVCVCVQVRAYEGCFG
jgi:hypothetical protein